MLCFLVCALVLAMVMVVVMRLENGGFVSSASADSIMVCHDFPQLVEVLENVDTDSSIQTRWFEHPQILVAVAAIRQFEWSFECLLFLRLAFIKLLVNHVDVLVNVFVDELHDA